MTLVDNVLAFVEGLALIASPCILPILPLVLSASIDGGKKRPLGIITGFILSFCIFAFFSRWMVSVLGLNLDYIKYGSMILLGLLGLVMISPRLTEKFSALTQGVAQVGTQFSTSDRGGFISSVGVGALIGLIWTPCAGPILAAVLVEIIREQNNLDSFITMLCFAVGAGLPMLIIAFTGRTLMQKMSFLKNHAVGLRQALGVLILASVAFIASGVDVEQLFSKQKERMEMNDHKAGLVDGLLQPYIAPDFAGIQAWLNSSPLKMEDLKGKVVLIDFWTYSCINCVRTLPYITGFDQKYRDKGLVVVGVHSPEFEFEKDVDNIKGALVKNNIHYPVAVDSMLSTWSAFHNQYWPAQYLIDKEGRVVYTHFGEGDDDILEHNIQYLLGLGQETPMKAEAGPQYHFDQTPETYLGFNRADRFIGKENYTGQYQFPVSLPEHYWALSGGWKMEGERIISTTPDAKLRLNFKAQKVFLVMGTHTGSPIEVKLLLNNKPLLGFKVDKHTLYQVVDQPSFDEGLLEVDSGSPGLELYAFTFG